MIVKEESKCECGGELEKSCYYFGLICKVCGKQYLRIDESDFYTDKKDAELLLVE